MTSLKVSSQSKPNAIAGALVAYLRENEGKTTIQTIGAGALNQAVKGVAIARGFVAPTGFDIICSPRFTDVEVKGETRTGMILNVTLIEK